MPEKDKLKKGSPDQPKNALDKISASGPRGIDVRGNLSVLSIYLWLINHIKIWYLELIFPKLYYLYFCFWLSILSKLEK